MTPGAVWLWWGCYFIITLVPVFVLIRAGARGRWFLLGMSGHVLGVAVELLLAQLFNVPSLRRLHPLPQAALIGLSFGFAEICIAILFLIWGKARLPDVLAFGVGIAAFQMLFATIKAWAEVFETLYTFTSPFMAADRLGWTFLLECFYRLVGYVASALLIFVAIRSRSLLPA